MHTQPHNNPRTANDAMCSDEVDLFAGEDDMQYLPISLIGPKIQVLIVGGGQAAALKARMYSRGGCRMTAVAPAFCDDLREMAREETVELIEAEYTAGYLSGCHLVIIATDDEAVNQHVQADCDQQSKLYLSCHDARQGLFVTPVVRESTAAVLALHTKAGSPRTAVFIAEKLLQQLRLYDPFITFACALRSLFKHRVGIRDVLDMVHSDHFLQVFVAEVQGNDEPSSSQELRE